MLRPVAEALRRARRGESFFERAWILGTQLPDTNLAVLDSASSPSACWSPAELLPGARSPFRRGSLDRLAVGDAACVAGIQARGYPPAVARSRPALAAPARCGRIIPLALACFLLAYIEGVSAARALAQKNGYEIDARQELLALGAANFAAALGQGYPVAGGLSQSTVNDKAGARTPLALVFASLTIAVCLVFLTGLLANLPNVVLAAIVLVAVKGLINIPELRRSGS